MPPGNSQSFPSDNQSYKDEHMYPQRIPAQIFSMGATKVYTKPPAEILSTKSVEILLRLVFNLNQRILEKLFGVSAIDAFEKTFWHYIINSFKTTSFSKFLQESFK